MRARIQTIPTVGEGRIVSRGRFVPVFLLGNKWQLMIFMGRSGPPAPSVSGHIRVSDKLNSHFVYLFICWAWSIHKTLVWVPSPTSTYLGRIGTITGYQFNKTSANYIS